MTSYIQAGIQYAYRCWKCDKELTEDYPVWMVEPQYFKRSNCAWCPNCKHARMMGKPVPRRYGKSPIQVARETIAAFKGTLSRFNRPCGHGVYLTHSNDMFNPDPIFTPTVNHAR